MSDKVKILILEDNPGDVELLQYHLKKLDYKVETLLAKTKKEFIEGLNTFTPDLILADYSLPSFDGLSAFHIKQEKKPEIPFIIVSSSIGEENAVKLIKLGVTDYALKDKLYTLTPKITRALQDIKALKEKKTAYEEMKKHREKLVEIAFLQSHQVRGPIASIIGLINLFNFKNPSDPYNTEVIRNLERAANSVDEAIRQIVRKTQELK